MTMSPFSPHTVQDEDAYSRTPGLCDFVVCTVKQRNRLPVVPICLLNIRALCAHYTSLEASSNGSTQHSSHATAARTD